MSGSAHLGDQPNHDFVPDGDTSRHDVLTMGSIGTPSLCSVCAHRPCVKRRREMAIPCVVCDSRIRPGQKYRVICRIGNEVVTQVHEDCERRVLAR